MSPGLLSSAADRATAPRISRWANVPTSYPRPDQEFSSRQQVIDHAHSHRRAGDQIDGGADK